MIDVRTWSAEIVGRFWSKVDRCGQEECWAWTAAISKSGYGNFGTKEWQISAHRASLLLAGKTVESGQVVMHLCNNKKCVNPAHLCAGSHGDNLKASFVDGIRSAKGSSHPQSKLTDEQVRRIRAMPKTGLSHKKIGNIFGVSQPLITMIVNRQIWSHLD